jgi:hypothetical protein
MLRSLRLPDEGHPDRSGDWLRQVVLEIRNNLANLMQYVVEICRQRHPNVSLFHVFGTASSELLKLCNLAFRT